MLPKDDSVVLLEFPVGALDLEFLGPFGCVWPSSVVLTLRSGPVLESCTVMRVEDIIPVPELFVAYYVLVNTSSYYLWPCEVSSGPVWVFYAIRRVLGVPQLI